MEEFHKHLNECKQCANNPWQLCEIGERLLRKSAKNLSISTDPAWHGPDINKPYKDFWG